MGDELPSLNNTAPSDLVGFRYLNGVWDQVPIQIDERVLLHVRTPYGLPANSPCLSPSNGTGTWNVWFYADPETNIGADSDSDFDANDELVFMYFDTGDPFTGGSCPNGVLSNILVEVLVGDPLNSSTSAYLYLFQQDGSLTQDAGEDYVNYTFGLVNGDPLSAYDECETGTKCPNGSDNNQCETSTIVTNDYEVAYSARWIEDVLKIKSGNASGQDILDVHQGFIAPSTEIQALGSGAPGSPCGRTESTFSESRGAIVTSTDGPVRAIRSVMGSNSGTFNQISVKFTESRADYSFDFRVHNFSNAPCAGFVDAFDLNQTASGQMTYYNNIYPGGFAVDGNQDNQPNVSVRDWELIKGVHGAIVAAYDYSTNIPITNRGDVCGPTDTGRGAVESYYDDGGANPLHNCTGDNQAHGTFGFRLLTDACTDRLYTNAGNNSCPGNNEEFVQYRYHYYLPPNTSIGEAQTYGDFAKKPLTVTTNALANACGGSPAINVSISEVNPISCNGGSDGSLKASASGGSGNYTYLWSNTASTSTISGLSANTYSVTATDSQSGNMATASWTLTEPTALSASISSTNETNGQANGTATATASGGTSPYSYLWSTSSTSNSISGLSAGTYQLTVSDDKDCTFTTSVRIINEVTGGCTYQQFDFENFEVNFGIWNDGGADCARVNPVLAGSYVVRLRNGTSTSRMYTNALNLSTAQELRVNFNYGANSMEPGEEFALNISTDGGNNFSTIQSWKSGVDFNSFQLNTSATATYTGTLNNNVVLEFRNLANQSNDHIFIDDVEIEVCENNQNRRRPTVAATAFTEERKWGLAPNPTRAQLQVSFPSPVEDREVKVSIIDNQGQVVQRQEWSIAAGQEQELLMVDRLAPGLYWLRVQGVDGFWLTRKFVVIR